MFPSSPNESRSPSFQQQESRDYPIPSERRSLQPPLPQLPPGFRVAGAATACSGAGGARSRGPWYSLPSFVDLQCVSNGGLYLWGIRLCRFCLVRRPRSTLAISNYLSFPAPPALVESNIKNMFQDNSAWRFPTLSNQFF